MSAMYGLLSALRLQRFAPLDMVGDSIGRLAPVCAVRFLRTALSWGVSMSAPDAVRAACRFNGAYRQAQSIKALYWS